MADTIFNSNIYSDSQGNWNTLLDNNFAPGVHILTAQSQDSKDIVILNIKETLATQKEVQVVKQKEYQVQQIHSAALYLPFMIFFFLTLLASFMLIYTARKGDENFKAKNAFAAFGIMLAVFSVILFSVIGYNVGLFNFNNLEPLKISKTQETPKGLVDINGTIVDPITRQGIGNIEISSGATTIKTSAGGNFNFKSIRAEDGLKVVLPGILRQISWKITQEGTQDLYFNLQMFNTLIKAINAESAGHVEDIYNELLLPSIKEKVALNDYIVQYHPIFDRSNMTDQELNVISVKSLENWSEPISQRNYRNAVSIELGNGKDLNSVYHLVFEQGQWWIAK